MLGLSEEEQLYVEVLENLMDTYEIERPVYCWGNYSWDFCMAALKVDTRQLSNGEGNMGSLPEE